MTLQFHLREEQKNEIYDQGIVIADNVVPEKELAFTYRHRKQRTFSGGQYALVDCFDPKVFGVEGQAHHIGSFAIMYSTAFMGGKTLCVASPSPVVTHEIPFSSQTAYYFGQAGFPHEYANPKLFKKLRRNTSHYASIVHNFFDGSEKREYVEDYVSSKHLAGDIIMLGSGHHHPLWALPQYHNLDMVLVKILLQLLEHQDLATGFIAANFSDRPVSFWESFDAELVSDNTAVIPFSHSAQEVNKIYRSSLDDGF